MPTIPDWARAHGELKFDARIRREAADFQVTEMLGYEFSGTGEHDFLWVEKKGANTAWVAEKLARHAGIREADIGYAGMKDRHAITRQWFSVRRPSAAGTDWSEFAVPDVTILECRRHNRKLRRGAHAANHFRIALTESRGDRECLGERLAIVRREGVPNYFGEQRFGREGNNIALAARLFAGNRLRRNQRGLAISAARSWLFNHILDARVREASWNRMQSGDRACLEGSNSFFTMESIDTDIRQRCEQMDIHPGGAMWGRGDPSSHGDVLQRELDVLQAFAEFRNGLETQASQSQRALRLVVRDFDWEISDDRIWLDFCLRRGGFATAVLREIARY